jgi:hypothetical protein
MHELRVDISYVGLVLCPRNINPRSAVLAPYQNQDLVVLQRTLNRVRICGVGTIGTTKVRQLFQYTNTFNRGSVIVKPKTFVQIFASKFV